MGRVRYRVTTTGKTITQIYYSSFEGWPTNADADARLISAAPDLLVALQGMVDSYEHEASADNPALIAARAALAKAEQ